MNSPAHTSLTPRFSLFHRGVALVLAALIATPAPVFAAPPVNGPVVIQTAYDGNDNLTSRFDGNGAQTIFIYDDMNRVIGIDYPGGSSPDVAFTYDISGNRKSMTDATGVTTFSHDIFDRLTRVDYPDKGFVIYKYDAASNVTEMLYGNLNAVNAGQGYTDIKYAYDEDNRIASVQNVFANTTTSFTYDDAGNPLRRTLPNGVTTDYGYDADGRLLSVDHKKADGTRICRYVYTLNAIGNRTQVVETLANGSTKTTSYTYDRLDRLETVTYPDGKTASYLYDSFGNRTKLTEITAGVAKITDYFYDSDSRLLSTKVNGTLDETFYYDREGNLVQRVRVSDNRLISYSYDIENKLEKYFDGENFVQYIYDGMGNRVAKISNGIRINFINDLNRKYVQVLGETSVSGASGKVYEWGNDLMNVQVGASRKYYLGDSIRGNVTRMVDSSGAISDSYECDAFGLPAPSGAADSNSYKFHSEYQECESNLVYLRARYFDPSTGRFLTRDPIPGMLDEPRTRTSYVFALNDPINRVDPSGMISLKEFGSKAIDFGASLITLDPGLIDPTYPQNYCGVSIERDATRQFSSAAEGVAWAYRQPYGHVDLVQNIACINHDFEMRANFGQMNKNVVPNAKLAVSSPNPGMIVLFGGMAGVGTVWEGANQIGSFVGKTLSSVGDFVGGALSWIFGGGSRPGGVALNNSAEVLLDINQITGGTFDEATGQIILFGKPDASPSALPKMSLDDLAVAVRAKQLGTFPVVSIEDPVVTNAPEWPNRRCFTVRYGPFHTDPLDGQRKVLDVSSKTHFGWVMYEADRLMKSLGLGKDNRTLQPVSSSVPGYKSWVNLAWDHFQEGNIRSRFWFNPKEIVVEKSPDGNSMQISKAEMQLSTETMFASNGQVESTPDAEYFSSWFTHNYDAIAEEQVSLDHNGQPRKIFKELKQLAYIAGIVGWIQDENIPVDLGFLNQYQPAYLDAAPSYTPETTVSESRTTKKTTYSNGQFIITTSTKTVNITGGVNFCNDLVIGSGGNPAGLGAAAADARPSETSLGWSFNSGGANYNATALSVDRKEKDGSFNPVAVDAKLSVNGSLPLQVARHFDSFDTNPTHFGRGWKAQPYALEFKGNREVFSICHQSWTGYGEVWFVDRTSRGAYKYVPAGTYDKVADPQGLASRFDPTKNILVYRYESKSTPGLLYSDNATRMTMKLDNGTLLDFNFDGSLTRAEDRNGNRLDYAYNASKRLTGISQPGGRSISLTYDSQGRISSASLSNGRTVTYSYNNAGDLVSAHADAPSGGRRFRYAYDAKHNLTQIQDENGNASSTQNFDNNNRLISTSQPGVATPLARNYDLAAKTSTTTGPEGLTGSIQFNAERLPVAVTDGLGKTTTTTYNSFRDQTSQTGPDGKTWKFYTDAKGQRVATVTPSNRADRVFYNAFGSPAVTFHAPVDADFNNSFNAEHQLTSTDYDYYNVNFTQYSYDANGNSTGVTDANSHTKTFGHDTKGNLLWLKDARGKQTDFTYDVNSNLTRIRNARGHQIDLTYDTRDNLTRVATAAGTTDYAYNAKNQVTSLTTGDVGDRRTTSYTYDAKGQISTVTDPNNFVTEYAYDARGNLTEVKHAGVVRFTYEYDGLNRLTATHYTGTYGGEQPAVIPTSPAGGERFPSGEPITLSWLTQGNWTGNTNVTIQYSLDGITWITLTTVDAATGSYVWNSPPGGENLRVRFLRPNDIGFRNSVTAAFASSTGAKYYVNDSSTTGDQYCTAAGGTYNGTTFTGRSSSSPVNNPQAIIDNNVLKPGDTIYIDTGAYNLTQDILITPADSGTVAQPVVFQGPTNGTGVASITCVAPASTSNAVFFLHDAAPADASILQGITISNLKVAGNRYGIWLKDAAYCTVRECDVSQSPTTAAAGQTGIGYGIFLDAGHHHLVEGNVCHHVGVTAGAVSAGNVGLQGTGMGIFVSNSSSNTIRANETYANKGTGSAGGSASMAAGLSTGYGIRVSTSDNTAIIGNVCHDNDATGLSPASGQTGTAQVFGIFVNGSTNTRVEGNLCHGNEATGGTSTAASGGVGLGIGIYVTGETGVTVSGNTCYGNAGIGGLGSTAAGFANGSAEGDGIRVVSCPSPRLFNNRCYDNLGMASSRRVNETGGSCWGYGIRLDGSAGAQIHHNVAERNLATFGAGIFSSSALGSQIYLSTASTGGVVKNNSCGAPILFHSCIAVSADSQSGFVADYNNYRVIPVGSPGSVGQWGNSLRGSLSSWQNVSLQDPTSTSVDPQYYNAAASNFHLTSTSPLIDRGTVSLTPAPADIDGETRPQQGPVLTTPAAPDIGCDEFLDSDGDLLSDAIESGTTFTHPNAIDSDGDRLRDDWEITHSLDPNSAVGANGTHGDPDGDGYDNLAESQAGTHPGQAGSTPGQPPVITQALPAISNPLIQEEDSLQFSASATDPNGDAVSYSWLLDGVVKSSAGTWLFTTNSESSGAASLTKTCTVLLRVTAGADVVTRTWDVTVSNRNRPPVLAVLPPLSVRPGHAIDLTPAYSDPDNQNTATGDDNQLAVTYSGFMTGPSRAVTADDIGSHTVTVRVQDNGVPPLAAERTFQVNVINAAVLVATDEGGVKLVEGDPAGSSYTLVLDSPPAAPVTVHVSPPGGLAAVPADLTFTPENWSTPQPVTLVATENTTVGDNRVLQVLHTVASSDPIYQALPVPAMDVQVYDDDNGGLGIVPGAATTATESGAGCSYTVALLFPPVAPVTVTVDAGSRLVASPPQLTFTPEDWSTPQSVQITAVNDDVAHGDASVTVQHTLASTDQNFNGIPSAGATIAVIDDEQQSLVLSDTTLQVPEGGSATFTVQLAARPPGDLGVTVAYTAGDSSVGVQSGSSLLFTAENWNVPQEVSLAAAEDVDVTGGTATITVSIPGLTAGTLTATESDNDALAFVVNTATLTVTEGGNASIHVKLNAQPAADITVGIARASGDADIAFSGTSLVFTPANWDITQIITLTAAEDADTIHGTATFEVTSPGVPTATVTVSESDNDVLSLAVTPTTLSVGEGSNASVIVKLNAQPAADITVGIGRLSGDGDIGYTGNNLVFTASNWNTGLNVTLTAAEDVDTVNGATTFEVTAPGLTTVQVVASESDNDILAVVLSSASLAIGEGSGASFQVRLNAQPVSDVTVGIARTSGDADITIANGAGLVFTPENWNVDQSVTLSAVEDVDVANGTAIFGVTAPGVVAASLTATETDNDTLAFTVNASALTIAEGGNATFQVKLNAEPSANVAVGVSRTSTDGGGDSDIAIQSGSNLVFTPANWNVNQTVTLTAAEDADQTNGIAFVAITAPGLTTVTVIVTESDNDIPPLGFVVPNTTFAVGEGTNASLPILLNAAPLADVTVTIARTAGDDDVTILSPESFVFTPVNWNVPQYYTVRAAEDDDVAHGSATLSITAPGLTTVTVTITEVDNDQLALTVTPSPLRVPEGTFAFATVSLNMAPPENLNVAVSKVDGGDPDLGLMVPGPIQFTPTNWSEPKWVVIRAEEDADQASGTATFSLSAPGLTTVLLQAREVDSDARIFRVKAGATGNADGSTWADALPDLQSALSMAPDEAEIWIAAGTYHPASAITGFAVDSEVSIYGGFSGTETELAQRDWRAHPVVLSGDLGVLGEPTDNAIHVITLNDTARLDGLTITGGYARKSDEQSTFGFAGGGVFSFGGDLQIANCRFFQNTGSLGGALFCVAGDATISSCVFEENSALVSAEDEDVWSEAAYGGAICLFSSGVSRIEDCIFARNSAAGVEAAMGGAIVADGEQVEIVRCLFDRNRASVTSGEDSVAMGGAVYNTSVDLLVTHCSFYGNLADSTVPLLASGAGIGGEPAKIRSSIFWANAVNGSRDAGAQIGWGTSGDDTTYSCIEGLGGYLDTDGNHGMDPLFANPQASDFHLMSAAGRWTGSAWVTDSVTSLCVDAADPAAPHANEPAPNGGRANMGHHGNTVEASLTPLALSISDTKVVEDDSADVTAHLRVRLSLPMAQTVTVSYATVADSSTAAAPADYLATSGSLSFPPGVQEQEILITVKGDLHFEEDETVHVDLSNPVGVPLGRHRGIVVITDREKDTDGDRIPDDFERTFGLDLENPDDAIDDTDGDTMTNLEEYLARTDPHQAASYLRVSQILEVSAAAGGGKKIVWASAEGTKYVLWRSYDLGEWVPLLYPVAATPPFNTHIDWDPAPSGKAFYRLDVFDDDP